MVLQRVGRQDLSSLQGCLECLEAVLDLVISDMECARYHAQHDVRFLGLDVFRYQLVQPAGSYLVVLVFLRLKQLDQVLHCGPEVSSDRQLLQGNHQVSVEYQISLQWIFIFLRGGDLSYSFRTEVNQITESWLFLFPTEYVIHPEGLLTNFAWE